MSDLAFDVARIVLTVLYTVVVLVIARVAAPHLWCHCVKPLVRALVTMPGQFVTMFERPEWRQRHLGAVNNVFALDPDADPGDPDKFPSVSESTRTGTCKHPEHLREPVTATLDRFNPDEIVAWMCGRCFEEAPALTVDPRADAPVGAKMFALVDAYEPCRACRIAEGDPETIMSHDGSARLVRTTGPHVCQHRQRPVLTPSIHRGHSLLPINDPGTGERLGTYCYTCMGDAPALRLAVSLGAVSGDCNQAPPLRIPGVRTRR